MAEDIGKLTSIKRIITMIQIINIVKEYHFINNDQAIYFK